MACPPGSPLFSFDSNATADIIDRLRKFREAYEPWHGYLCLIICTFGLLTNMINVIVLTKRQMRTSINMLLTGIAICDMGTMASYLIYILHFVFTDQSCNPHMYSYSWMLFLVCHIILSVALHTTGLWLAVVMAFIRNMTLKRAMNGSKWLRSTNTWKICIFVYACVFILCIPSVFGSDIVVYSTYFNDTCKGDKRKLAPEYETRYLVYTIGIPENNCLVYTITLWLTGTVFKIIPCILLAGLITSLLWTIKKAEKRRRALFESNSTNRARLRLRQQQQALQGIQPAPAARSDRTTTMLLVILGLFLLTELPQGAISILTGIYMGDVREVVYPNLGDILDLLSLINSAVNFVLYCSMSSKYRQVFWQVVLPRKVYVKWYLRPRTSINNGFMQSQEPALMAHAMLGTGRPFRPQMRTLASMADRVEMEDQDERESTVIGLYRARGDQEAELSMASDETVETGAAGSRRGLNFGKKKTSDTNLRRQVLTRAAFLAVPPALAGSASTPQTQISQGSPVIPNSATLQDGSDQERPLAKQKKHRWLISCSCLCKCACRSGSGSEASRLDPQRASNLIKHNLTMATATETVVAKDGPDLCPPVIQDDAPHSLCSPRHLWRKCSNTSHHTKEYVFV